MSKTCSNKSCKELNPQSMDSYWNDKSSEDGKSSVCIACRKISHLNFAPKRRAKILLAKYGLTEEQYDQRFAKQGHCCAICKSKDSKTKTDRNTFCVDHCHETGIVRGLLCSDCNAGLGKLGDTYEAIERVLEYLKDFKKK